MATTLLIASPSADFNPSISSAKKSNKTTIVWTQQVEKENLILVKEIDVGTYASSVAPQSVSLDSSRLASHIGFNYKKLAAVAILSTSIESMHQNHRLAASPWYDELDNIMRQISFKIGTALSHLWENISNTFWRLLVAVQILATIYFGITDPSRDRSLLQKMVYSYKAMMSLFNCITILVTTKTSQLGGTFFATIVAIPTFAGEMWVWLNGPSWAKLALGVTVIILDTLRQMKEDEKKKEEELMKHARAAFFRHFGIEIDEKE